MQALIPHATARGSGHALQGCVIRMQPTKTTRANWTKIAVAVPASWRSQTAGWRTEAVGLCIVLRWEPLMPEL